MRFTNRANFFQLIHFVNMSIDAAYVLLHSSNDYTVCQAQLILSHLSILPSFVLSYDPTNETIHSVNENAKGMALVTPEGPVVQRSAIFRYLGEKFSGGVLYKSPSSYDHWTDFTWHKLG
jgi:hypothetical protein